MDELSSHLEFEHQQLPPLDKLVGTALEGGHTSYDGEDSKITTYLRTPEGSIAVIEARTYDDKTGKFEVTERLVRVPGAIGMDRRDGQAYVDKPDKGYILLRLYPNGEMRGSNHTDRQDNGTPLFRDQIEPTTHLVRQKLKDALDAATPVIQREETPNTNILPKPVERSKVTEKFGKFGKAALRRLK